jgi:CRP-like cAMP-binding protein
MVPGLDCTQCPSVRRSPFACLKGTQRSRLAKAALPHAYARGQVLFHQGTPAHGVFCVRSGLVKLTRQINRRGAAMVGVRTTGDLIGHRAVLGGTPYSISAETIAPSVVCTILREDFLAVIRENGELALQLLHRLAREFDFEEEQLAERASEPVRQRTARLLVRLAEGAAPATGDVGGWVSIPTRREDLALLLGTTPETLSRTLRGLSQRGLIRVGRNEVQVLDPDGLRRLTE